MLPNNKIKYWKPSFDTITLPCFYTVVLVGREKKSILRGTRGYKWGTFKELIVYIKCHLKLQYIKFVYVTVKRQPSLWCSASAFTVLFPPLSVATPTGGPTVGAPPFSSQWQRSTATPSLLSFQGNRAALLKGATSSASVQRGLLEAGSPAVDRIAGTSLTHRTGWKNGVDSVMVSTRLLSSAAIGGCFLIYFIKTRGHLNMDKIWC